MLKGLPEKPRIPEIGYGLGMQAVTLAKLSNGEICATDNHQPFLEQLKKTAKEEGVADKITAVNADMTALNYEDEASTWCEGAIFIGFEKGIREWKKLVGYSYVFYIMQK